MTELEQYLKRLGLLPHTHQERFEQAVQRCWKRNLRLYGCLLPAPLNKEQTPVIDLPGKSH